VDDLTALITRTHQALDVRTGVTHAEVRLTPSGPRLVELNGRLGGDFIPYLGQLATGVDLTLAAADLALGHVPDTRATRNLCAEVRFLYPPHDGVVRSLDVSAATDVAGAEVVMLAAPGSTLLLPPRGVVPRLAALIVTGDTPQACRDALDEASSLIRLEIEPMETAGDPSWAVPGGWRADCWKMYMLPSRDGCLIVAAAIAYATGSGLYLAGGWSSSCGAFTSVNPFQPG
jgi:biotin carboxylase